MGRLRRYNELLNGISPHYANVVVQPRGFPIFSDPLLKGQVRFARKTGADFAIINPDNEIQLLAAAPVNTRTLFLERPNRWLEIGAVLSLGPDIEFAVVRDFSDTLIQLTEPVTGSFPAGTGVNLYATPIFPAADASAGDTEIIVKSRYHILSGDNISFVTTENLLTSLLDIKVSRARLLSVVDTEAPFSLFYEIILEEPTTVDITVQQGVDKGADIYLKAQPSYLSNQVFLPQVPGHPDDIGPFLLDYVSGVLFDRPDVEEQMSLTVFDKLGNPIVDDNSFPLPINKQFPITEMPVMGDSVVLWKVASGAMTFGKRGISQEITAIAVCDDRGQFQTTQEVIPTLPSGTEWNVPVEASTPCTLKVTFVPNEPREFVLEAVTSRQVLIGTTADDEPIERIEIIVIGQDDTQVQLGNWVPTENQAFSIIYGITADVYGEAQWQATNMFQKPYFLNFAMGLKGKFNSSRTPNRFDGGMLFL